MAQFTEAQPSREDIWRAIVLLGQNVACYKFALARSLLELSVEGKNFVTLDELAIPFSKHIAAHLKNADKQATSRSSRFLDACRAFNAGAISDDDLTATTVRLGFNNVIDAFHVVNRAEVPVRFFVDERRRARKGIALTDHVHLLNESTQTPNLPLETEARWRLVETAWELNASRSLITVDYDLELGSLYTEDSSLRRVNITSCRDALNGYQKGKCFYCFTDISLAKGADNAADVDHFFAHKLKEHRCIQNLDGVWNLVLTCDDCNRGVEGKFARVPQVRFLERLHARNEKLIASHHPLREMIILQTGNMEDARVSFLQYAHSEAMRFLIQTWEPRREHPAIF